MSQEPAPPTQPSSSETSDSSPEATAEAPLSADLPEVEVDLSGEEDSISVLFGGDPMRWNEQDMARMVAHLREKRIKLDAGEKTPKAKKAAAEKVPKEELKGISGLDLLGKLGLGSKS